MCGENFADKSYELKDLSGTDPLWLGFLLLRKGTGVLNLKGSQAASREPKCWPCDAQWSKHQGLGVLGITGLGIANTKTAVPEAD